MKKSATFYRVQVGGRTLPKSKGSLKKAFAKAKQAAAKGPDEGPTFRVERCSSKRGRRASYISCGRVKKVFKAGGKVISHA